MDLSKEVKIGITLLVAVVVLAGAFFVFSKPAESELSEGESIASLDSAYLAKGAANACSGYVWSEKKGKKECVLLSFRNIRGFRTCVEKVVDPIDCEDKYKPVQQIPPAVNDRALAPEIPVYDDRGPPRIRFPVTVFTVITTRDVLFIPLKPNGSGDRRTMWFWPAGGPNAAGNEFRNVLYTTFSLGRMRYNITYSAYYEGAEAMPAFIVNQTSGAALITGRTGIDFNQESTPLTVYDADSEANFGVYRFPWVNATSLMRNVNDLDLYFEYARYLDAENNYDGVLLGKRGRGTPIFWFTYNFNGANGNIDAGINSEVVFVNLGTEDLKFVALNKTDAGYQAVAVYKSSTSPAVSANLVMLNP